MGVNRSLFIVIITCLFLSCNLDNDIHHYDYNFIKAGWYKIVDWHKEPIGNDPRHSSVEFIYFYEPDRRY